MTITRTSGEHDEGEAERRERGPRARVCEDRERRRGAARDVQHALQERNARDGGDRLRARERQERRHCGEHGSRPDEDQRALGERRRGQRSNAALHEIELELRPAGERDESERERVERLQSLHRFDIDQFQHVRPRDDPNGEIRREVRDLHVFEHLTHELAAREEQTA